MREYMEIALEQIKAGNLSDAQYCTARLLLDRVSPQGEVYLTTKEALLACRITSLGALRGHLAALKSAGIIRYNIIADKVQVRFTAWATSRTTEGDHV